MRGGSRHWMVDWRLGKIRQREVWREVPARCAITGYDIQSLMNMAYVASRFG
jgi:hypothetical protein